MRHSQLNLKKKKGKFEFLQRDKWKSRYFSNKIGKSRSLRFEEGQMIGLKKSSHTLSTMMLQRFLKNLLCFPSLDDQYNR